MTTTTKQAIDMLRASSDECINNGDPQTMPEDFSVGDIFWQGDIGLLMVDSMPASVVKRTAAWGGDLQLAEGNSKGSRHCIPSRYEAVIEVYYQADNRDPLAGPWIKATGQFPMTHPEHGDHLGYPSGLYQVRHQQNSKGAKVID